MHRNNRFYEDGINLLGLLYIGAVRARRQQEETFRAIEDERFFWLELDFVSYIEDLHEIGGISKQKITMGTNEATLLATRSQWHVNISSNTSSRPLFSSAFFILYWYIVPN